MKRSATVVIIPLISLLLAGVFAPQASEAEPYFAETYPVAPGWIVSFLGQIGYEPASSETLGTCDDSPENEPIRSPAAPPIFSD